jgi:mRNA interferase MazF
MGMVINRFDVYLIRPVPAGGIEIQKTRPCLVVSPNELNRHIRTVIVAPMTTKGHHYPTQIPCRFQSKVGQIALDQMRTVDHARLIKKLGKIDNETAGRVVTALQELFAA